ncbi:MAG: sigma-70 family RNA polymerase sigma factor, partial [Clostridia bacterium]|nr:sigma-70 family RNA polymerase sigma factor [Clostridia bacterium]
MDYSKIDEKEIIKLARTDEKASEYVLDKYKGLVISLARKHYLDGGDIEDLISEGMIGLYKAILTFDENNSATFLTYAHVVITRQMINAVKKGASINKITGKSDILIE